MRKIREILRLTHELKLSVRQVSEAIRRSYGRGGEDAEGRLPTPP